MSERTIRMKMVSLDAPSAHGGCYRFNDFSVKISFLLIMCNKEVFVPNIMKLNKDNRYL